MKMHPRFRKVQEAKAEISMALVKLQENYNLTDIEFLQILNELGSTTLKYMIRIERHGNIDKKADEA